MAVPDLPHRDPVEPWTEIWPNPRATPTQRTGPPPRWLRVLRTVGIVLTVSLAIAGLVAVALFVLAFVSMSRMGSNK